MAEFKMTAGGKFETLTRDELDASLKTWMVESVKGMRPIRFDAQGAATAAAVTMGGATTLTGGRLGPEVGYVWAVQRLAVRVEGQPGAFSVYVNAANPANLVRDVNALANGYAGFGRDELLLSGSDTLVIQGSTAGESGLITVSGAAVEMPVGLLWKWLAG